MNNLLSFLFLFSLFTNFSFALIPFQDAAFPELATSARALGMGNAFLCKVDDAHSAFYNPAGLGTVRWGHFHLTNLHVELNDGLMKTALGGSSSSSSNIGQAFSLDGSRQILLEKKGTLTHSRIQAIPNITFRYLSAGFLYSLQSKATIGLENNAKFEFSSRLDYGPFVAGNLSVFGGVLKVGASAILLTRKEIIDELDSSQPVELVSSDFGYGRALIYNVGGRITLPIVWLPTLAGVIHNFNKTPFTNLDDHAPETIKSSMDLGFSLTPQISDSVRVHLEVNYKDFNKQFPDVVIMRKILAGIEIDFIRHIFLRFGYGDGFGSAGIGMRYKRLETDITTYAVDTTANGFRGKEDRRFVFSLSSGF